jgi:nitrogen fixation/metabolism regulation signal transduction histidine kinase
MIDNLTIIKDGEVILNNTSYELVTNTFDFKKNSNTLTRHYEDEYLVTYKYYSPFDWTIVISEDKKQLMAFFYESYKYNILTGIIFLTFSLQMTILIALNITKPIQKLVNFCALVASGEHGERILFKRKDEIGQLGLAFNQMLDKLDSSMNELISVKNYNQDILNNIEKGIVTFDASKTIISKNPFANQIIDELSGYSYQGQVLLTVINEIVSLSQINKTSNNSIFEFISDDDGEVKYIDFYTSIMRGETDDVHGYICSFNDITKRKKLKVVFKNLIVYPL